MPDALRDLVRLRNREARRRTWDTPRQSSTALMAGRSSFLKVVVILAALALLGFLFIRSLQSTRSAPYTLERAHLQNWTLALEPATSPTAPILVLRGPLDLVSSLFRQVFARAMESLNTPPAASIPILLKGEFDGGIGAVLTPDALLAAARGAGLESARYEPRCLAHRRISQPGSTRQVFFAVFDSPEFDRFRRQLADRAGAETAARVAFDPLALSPVMFVAGSDPSFHRWLPLAIGQQADCLAPIEVG